jgi:outer membrane protein insertion porin family
MKKWIVGLFIILVPLLSFGQEMIERIDIAGNERVNRDTVMYYLTAREGDYYSQDLLKKDFMVLWSTGFFSNIRIEEAQGTRGKIVKIYLEENPIVKTISYKTGKKVKEDDIVNKLKEKDEYVLAYSYYSPGKIQKIKKTIEDLLAEKGLHAAKVALETNKKGKSEVDIVFNIDEGPKVRIGDIVFTGKPKLPQSTLLEAMSENKPLDLISWLTGKSVYKQNKMTDDIAAVKKKFQEYGYMEATIGEPKIEQITTRKFPFFKKQTMLKVTIPVNAGYLYRVGEIKIEGNKAFTAKGIQTKIKFVKDEIYNTKIREKSVEDIGELFRNFGHLYGQVVPVENLDPKNKVVNVTYQIIEGDPCFLRRLDFKGNVFTKDKVIRREMILREGDRFSLALFKDSILRVKQLGLVDLEKDPDIKPSQDDSTQFDVSVNVKELQRNNIQFTAGYSGYEGTFIAASYSTVNFLGAGENLEITAQYGKRIKNYVFGFREPYLFDSPVSVGFNIYDRYMIYTDLYDQKSRGIDFTFGSRLSGYWSSSLTYSFQDVNITKPSVTSTTRSSEYDAYYAALYGWGRYFENSITPSIYYTTIDSPLTPMSGTMYLISLKYAGTFLGGEVHMVKPNLQFTHYQLIKQGIMSFGFHVEYSEAKPLRNSKVPYWEKFFLGGERNIRGYEVYTIGPKDENDSNLGGLKSLVINAELILHVGGQESPLYLIAFHDMGNAYSADERVSLKNVYTSTGVEARIFVPALRVPFRLIFSYNNRLIYSSDSNFAFRFAIGTTF